MDPEARKPAYDMKRFRRELRAIWRAEQLTYVNADSRFRRLPDGRLGFRKMPFPEMKLVRERERGEDAE